MTSQRKQGLSWDSKKEQNLTSELQLKSVSVEGTVCEKMQRGRKDWCIGNLGGGRESVWVCMCVSVYMCVGVGSVRRGWRGKQGPGYAGTYYCVKKIGFVHQRQAIHVCWESEWECFCGGMTWSDLQFRKITLSAVWVEGGWFVPLPDRGSDSLSFPSIPGPTWAWPPAEALPPWLVLAKLLLGIGLYLLSSAIDSVLLRMRKQNGTRILPLQV